MIAIITRETGNYFYRARYYNPTLGRFISRDPLSGAEFSQGTNLYAYCGNNFLNAIDPTGLTDYDAASTQATLNAAAAAATAGPIQGLLYMYNNNQGGGTLDFGIYGINDTYNVNGVTVTSDQFANYIAGYEAQAYDDAYLGGIPEALGAMDLAGIAYHNIPGGSKETNDPGDETGLPLVQAGAFGEAAGKDPVASLVASIVLISAQEQSAEAHKRANHKGAACEHHR